MLPTFKHGIEMKDKVQFYHVLDRSFFDLLQHGLFEYVGLLNFLDSLHWHWLKDFERDLRQLLQIFMAIFQQFYQIV
jgi:hypothetical protein